MSTLKEALTIERNRLFVGRDAELGFMRCWLTQQDAPTEVLFISGMGGIGKSALMLQFLNMAQNENILSIWLDGRRSVGRYGGKTGLGGGLAERFGLAATSSANELSPGLAT